MDDSGRVRTATMVESPPDEPIAVGAASRPPLTRIAGRIVRAPHTRATAGFLALTTAVYWPVVAHVRTRILADSGDGSFFLWDMWSLPRALLGGHNPFHTQ